MRDRGDQGPSISPNIIIAALPERSHNTVQSFRTPAVTTLPAIKLTVVRPYRDFPHNCVTTRLEDGRVLRKIMAYVEDAVISRLEQRKEEYKHEAEQSLGIRDLGEF